MAQFDESQLDLIVVSTKDKVIMVEAGAKEISEDIVLKAVKFAHEANQDIIRIQEELQRVAGKPKLLVPEDKVNTEALSALSKIVDEKLEQVLRQTDKTLREQMLEALI